MRKALDDFEADMIVGGVVYLSDKRMKVGFTTTGETFNLLCDFKDARDLLNDLYDENSNMSDTAFDSLVKSEFSARGYI